ncbi:MAG: diguanylate cyclase response regulator [Rhodocyclales bacterium RIFCSPLOWO2_02_FULL_63_24]|nr:MAG: diguanylate cyclase response regulator [Rhodocyclales bacterium GWA2_65_19]OHC71933.1 MAG: diguanylate cyclase response regulator [Rhodocyclales bacterium RIFCSPLOWO2_02_FULL_63_24]
MNFGDTPTAEAESTLGAPIILIVDDQTSNIKLLAAILGDDYRIRVATNGPDALKMAESQPQPDLILLDIVMPDMDGYEVCRRLKENSATQNLPVIFITALSSEADEERGLNLGAIDYIAKPLSAPIVRARVRNHAILKRKADLLESLAHVDSLTNIANRRRFDHMLQLEWRRCQRAGVPLALLLIDVDAFKAYNDHYGHGKGDLCLTTIANTLATGLLRPADSVARYGGEEFSVLLPETNRATAALLGERLRERIAAKQIPHAPAQPWASVTISVGCAAMLPTESHTPRELIDTADRKLYEAKKAGRNRVCA